MAISGQYCTLWVLGGICHIWSHDRSRVTSHLIGLLVHEANIEFYFQGLKHPTV